MKAKDRNTRRDIRKELKTLSKEERKRQQLAVTDVLKNADVVLTTLTGSLSRKLDGFSFDLVIIDEAAQALEIACWMALLKVSTNKRLTDTLCKNMYTMMSLIYKKAASMLMLEHWWIGIQSSDHLFCSSLQYKLFYVDPAPPK